MISAIFFNFPYCIYHYFWDLRLWRIKIAPKIGALDIPKDDMKDAYGDHATVWRLCHYMGGMVCFCFALPGTTDQQMIGIAVGATLILIMGIIDDIHGLSAKVKPWGRLLAPAFC